MDKDLLINYFNIFIVLVLLIIILIIFITKRYFNNIIKELSSEKNNILQKNKYDWKYDEYGDLFFNVIKNDYEYKKRFQGLGIFENLEEKEKFIWLLLFFLVLSPYEYSDNLLKQYIGKKEESFVKEFLEFWYKNNKKFINTEEYKRIISMQE